MKGKKHWLKLTQNTKLSIVIGIALTLIGALITTPPIPAPADYHDHADKRELSGLPHFFDVVSSFPFFLVGMLGLLLRLKPKKGHHAHRFHGLSFLDPAERWPFVIFFVGIILGSLGSVYYHLAPNNERLLWDRLPTTLVFISIFTAVIIERIHVKAGLWLFLPLLAGGVGTVLFWHYKTQLTGLSDLRLVLVAQYYPMLIIPVIMLFFPSKYTRSKDLWGIIGLYALAEVFEMLDDYIFSFGQVISGNTLEHLTAALATYWVVSMLKKRHPLPHHMVPHFIRKKITEEAVGK